MNYTIMHETSRSIRIRLEARHLTRAEAAALQRALTATEGVTRAAVYPASGGVYLEYDCPREALLAALAAADGKAPAEEPYAGQGYITAEEQDARKLHPALKKRTRNEILLEAAADLFLPAPLQFAFHACQLAQLKNK